MFENPEIYPYHRTKQEKKKIRRRAVINNVRKRIPQIREKAVEIATPEALALAGAGFFLGRAVLLGELSPFGTALAAAAIRVCGRSGFLAVPAVILGLVTVSRGLPLAGSIITVLCLWFLIRSIPLDIKRPWLVLPLLVLAVTVVVKTSFIAFNSPSSYDYFSILFEGVFAAILTPVMVLGIEAVKRKPDSTQPLSGEEIFCILLICGGIIAGTGEIGYAAVSLKGILSKFTILLVAVIGGAGAGAAAGAIMGTIPGLTYVTGPVMVGAYAFAGLLGGVCKSFGKVGVATGFLLGNIILTVYINDYGNMVAILLETGIATLLFMLVPMFFIADFRSTLGLEKDHPEKHPADGYYKEIFKERITSWARIFNELSRTFEQVSSTAGQSWEEQNLQKMLSLVSEKVCSSCSFYSTCWEREFYKTYQGLIDMLTRLELFGLVTPDGLPEDIKRRCTRTKELAITVSCLYETYNVNRYWSRRLLESRQIVSEQLRGVSGVINSLPAELEFEAGAGDLEPNLRRKLKEAGAPVDNLSIYRLEGKGSEVSITRQPCGGAMCCKDIIMPVLTRALNQPLYCAASICTARVGDTSCHLRFYPDLNYRLSLGVAGIGRNGSIVSGDSYAFIHLKGGRFVLALSDGMGSGPRAALESGTTLSLLRYLLESGFGQDLAIKTINSILVLRSPGESFATVDMAVMNLGNGQADFVKIGAVSTFFVRGGQVELIKASSLPVGIVDDIEVSTVSRVLEPGDLLVMVTDGVLDSYKGEGDREEWLAGILSDVTDMQPQEVADLFLKLAQTGAGGTGRAPDDMTVLVARVGKQRYLKY
ncbi:MAG: stage II sporulation protein E [Desulfotomaculaceae bacterium]|nr:stage II sporulation protein E [Desulfotomaculaceae bacterium]MDD4766795.1 stage II sporulation protein E [Desulfotomaculaceae bacterium]